MPELPDVEGFRSFLARHAEGQRIIRVEVPDPMLARNSSPQALGRALSSRRFGPPARHGKWLLAPLEGGSHELLFHFGMTGLLRWGRDARDRHRHDRVVFVCEGGELRYNNMRRFGGIWLANDPSHGREITGPLGPDAADLQRDDFARLLERRRGGVKAALMDQTFIAGIGNLLSDEILWRARIHPATPVHRLSMVRRRRLYESLHAAVSESIRHGRIPRGEQWLTRVRDERNATCPRCGNRLRRSTIAGRTTCWCPRDQR